LRNGTHWAKQLRKNTSNGQASQRDTTVSAAVRVSFSISFSISFCSLSLLILDLSNFILRNRCSPPSLAGASHRTQTAKKTQ
jgi:hypothetical protein